MLGMENKVRYIGIEVKIIDNSSRIIILKSMASERYERYTTNNWVGDAMEPWSGENTPANNGRCGREEPIRPQ